MNIRIGIVIIVSACVIWGLMAVDAPAPGYAQFWSKADYTESQTRAFLYGECGFSDKPADVLVRDGKPDVLSQWLATFAASEQCMLTHGFIYTDAPKRGWGKCEQKVYRDFPSCVSMR